MTVTKKSVRALAGLIKKMCPQEGLNETLIPSVKCLKFSRSTPVRVGVWPQSFVIVVQGQKQIRLLKTLHKFGEAHYVATPIDLMVESQVKVANPDEPYLAVLIDLDPKCLAALLEKLPDREQPKISPSVLGLYSAPVTKSMIEAATRLLKSMESKHDARVLGSLAVDELYFHLLSGPHGYMIQQFALSSGFSRRISEAVASLKTRLAHDVDLDQMAKTAKMSRSTFFRAFKKHTSLSPVQFMKALRLNEGRRLLQTEGTSVETAAFTVGYKSSSQFSREYSRHFGRAPKGDKRAT